MVGTYLYLAVEPIRRICFVIAYNILLNFILARVDDSSVAKVGHLKIGVILQSSTSRLPWLKCEDIVDGLWFRISNLCTNMRALTHKHTWTHIYRHQHTNAQTSTHKHTHTNTHNDTHQDTRAHAQTHIFTDTHTHTRMHKSTWTHMHAHIPTHLLTHSLAHP